MLKLFDYLEDIMEEHNNRQWYYETRLDYFANEIMELLGIDEMDFAYSLTRTFQACQALKIPANHNFKKVYRFDGSNLITDWKVSPLACYLIIINCNPANEQVAKAQLFFAMNQVSYKSV
ncbi:MAG: hypothetical protein WAQ28_04110 [Bacteroidia bacterium]|jgi:hypothetical protein